MPEKTFSMDKTEEVKYRRGINLITMGGAMLIIWGALPSIAFFSGVRPVEYLWMGIAFSGVGAVLSIANYVMGWNKYPVAEEGN